ALVEAPSGMTIGPMGDIHWTPDATQAGTVFVIVQVRDARGGMALQEYRLTVLPLGIDLAVTGVDTSAVTTDTQTLVIGGTVRICLHNQGSSAFSGSFVALVFEDRNSNGTFDPGVDNVVGTATFSGPIASNARACLDVRVSGTVLFRDTPLYALVDSAQQIPEVDRTNNLGNSGQASTYLPPAGGFQPQVKWQISGAATPRGH